MRALLFHARPTHPSIHDWNQFLQKARKLGPSSQAEELADGLWLLPLPDCQNFLDGLTQLVRLSPQNVSATSLSVDFRTPWQPVS